MPPWKRLLLHLYYQGTRPIRAAAAATRAVTGRAPVMVLMYHRIADDRDTPWTVSNRTFARQIAWLKPRFDLVSLAEAQARIRSGHNSRACVSITFDDGYAENCQQALPLLIDQRIAFTYFVATRFVVEGKPFPHDVALGHSFSPNTVEQLRALVSSGAELAGHTRTHADLGRVADSDTLYDEMVGGARELEDLVGRPVSYFAFPYGQYANLSLEAFGLAKEAGFAGVCSAYGGFNFPGDDEFHIQRFAVDDDLVRLKNWVTVDPRKLSMHSRFEYDGRTRSPSGRGY
jgi:peptidoglycan/xylan/chitin deacetylase (PgdA/CDA1 family)